MTAPAAAWPEDGWYALGGSGGLQPGQARAGQLLGRDLACWRGESGRFHAWRNRCAHRGMRLSFGFVRGEQLTCRYHGWRYDQSGQCSLIPAHPNTRPPKAAAIPGYGAVEQDGLLWVRLGAGENPPPDLASLAPAGGAFAFCQSLFLVQAPVELAQSLANLIFLPTALATDTKRHAWRYRVESRKGASVALRWCAGDAEEQSGQLCSYRSLNPLPGIYVISADAPGLPLETRLLALQPMADKRTALHIMTAQEDRDATAARAAAARWARRLRWFLENDGRGAKAYNPWLQGENTP